MNALEKLMQPVTRLMNQQIGLTTPARELCRELEGKVIAVRVRNTALALHFKVGSDGIDLLEAFEGEPDAVISGSLVSLAATVVRVSERAGEAAVRGGSLELAGDAEVARSFQKLLNYGKPDLEEELSAFVGDVAAYGVGDIVRNLGRWGRDAGSILLQNVSEYLQEESRALPTRYEVEDFHKRVDTLRDDVARMDVRLRRLESLTGPDTARG